MSQHWVPEDDAATGGRPRLDDDTEGHAFVADKAAANSADEDDTEGHLHAFDKAAANSADDDDIEGHVSRT